jgi:hypothetical protein
MAEPRQPGVQGPLDTQQKLQAYLDSCPPGLTHLNLSRYHQIASLEGVQFPPGLTALILAENRIVSLEGVQFPPGLTTLNLSQNQIASLEGVQFPSTLHFLNLARNRITSVRGVQFPRGVAHFNFEGNPLTSLAGMINPNQIIKNHFMTYYNSLYLRDIEGEKAARQSQKAEFARTNDLTQQSMRNQLNAITSFLHEGMQARAMEKNESMKTNRFVIFVRMANDMLYRVPYASDMKAQSVLDYLNEHYYISALFPNHGLVRLIHGGVELDPSRTLGDYGIQNEATLYAKGKIIQGGGKRHITTRSERSKNKRNKSKSIKKRT